MLKFIPIMQNSLTHNPVLLAESISSLNIFPEGIYIDGTFGRGGHTLKIIEQLTTGRVIAFDKDLSAIEFANKNITNTNIELIHGDFADMITVIKQKNLLGKIAGIFFDLGVSSPQLDDKQRGFSFNADGDLDMRMDINQKLNAKNWLNSATEAEIANVLYNYGEEKQSRIIAKKIKQFQQNQLLTTTKQLVDIIKTVVRTKNGKNPATRSFQAIRIHVNQELQALTTALENSLQILQKNGILSVISFHSLEDRIVKRFIQKHSRNKQTSKNLPPIQQHLALKNLGKQKPTPNEIKTNTRSRSAILRVAKKC